MTGTIAYLDAGIGYIAVDGRRTRVFFHYTNCATKVNFSELGVGQRVEFTLITYRNTPARAVQVRVIE